MAIEAETQKSGDKVAAAITLLEGRLDRFRQSQEVQFATLKVQQDKFQAEIREAIAGKKSPPLKGHPLFHVEEEAENSAAHQEGEHP